MRWLQGLLGGLGLLTLLLAALVAFGAASGPVPVADLVARLGNDYFLVAGLGVAVLLATGPVLVSGRSGRVTATKMPTPEAPRVLPTPGDALDEAIADPRTMLPFVGRRTRQAARERLRVAAVATLARRAGGRERADRLVATGEWTTDPVAGAFLAEGVRPASSTAARLRALATGTTPLQLRVDRTVTAIEQVRLGPPRGREEAADGGRRRH